MTQETSFISEIHPGFQKLDRTKTFVRAANRTRDLLAQNEKKPLDSIDNLDSAQAIGKAYLERFYEIYADLRTGRSQFDKRVLVNDIEKKFSQKYLDDEEKAYIERIFQKFAESLFNPNGNPKEGVKVPRKLYRLYNELENSALYDTQTAFGQLLFEMGVVAHRFTHNFAKEKMDFRRSEKNADILTRIEQAMDNKRDAAVPHIAPFINPPGRDMVTFLKIDGCSFPIHRIESPEFPHGQWHLVLKDGTLVNATDEVREDIREQLANKKAISNIDLSKYIGETPLNVIDYLNETSLNAMNPKARDLLLGGINACRNRDQNNGVKAQALVCLDQDEATGLRMDNGQFKEFNEFLDKNKYPMASLMVYFCRMKGTPEERADKIWEQIIIRDGAEKQPLDIIEAPLKRAMLKAYEEAYKQLPADLAPQANPMLVVVQGGTASGKGGAEKMSAAFIGKDARCMRASLDDSRALLDPAYSLVVATNNHHYDYMNFSGFGEMTRAAIVELALEHKQHLVMDSSGIPWRGKNEGIAQKFHDNGFRVGVFSTSNPLHLDPEESERLLATIFMNLGRRGIEEQRYVPIKVVIDKATGEAIAVQNSQASPVVDNFLMVDSTFDGFPKPVIAYSQDITADLIPLLQKARTEGTEAFKAELLKHGLIPEWMNHEGKDLWPQGKECNFEVALDYVDENGKDTGLHRIIVITDNEHVIRAQEKGLLNPSPKGADDLLTNWLPFDIAGHFQNGNGKLKLTNGDLANFRETEWEDQAGLLQPAPSTLGKKMREAKSASASIA